MYYLKISDEDGNIGDTLIYYCRNCGHEDTTLSTTNICVSDMQLLTSEKKYTHIVNEYTKFDPTLPRINTIKCPNQECSSNTMGGGVGKTAASKAAAESKAAAKAEEKASKAASKAAEKASKTASKAALKASKTNKKTGLQQVLEEQEEIAEEQQEQAQTLVEQQAQQQAEQGSGENNREVIYIRYDDTNMKYVYLCVHCDTTWRTDNRL